ncbi:MAG: alpha/beta fold hydrolase [Thermoleophilaceae bacterium]
METASLQDVQEGFAEVNSVRLHYVEAGSGPLLLLLHGFPEFWYSWRHQIPALAEAGFHVVAPDMRGYNLSDKPQGWRSYDGDQLAGDTAGLVRHFGAERAHVVGHDWGAAVTYLTAMRHPEAVERVGILNVPHPERMLAGLRRPRQMLRSWYMFFFQLPWLPETVSRRRDFAAWRALLRRDAPQAFSEADLDRYAEAWAQPGAVESMINYYRAALRQSPRAAQSRMRPIESPVLVIWGEQDRALGSDLAEPDPRWVPNARVERIAEASHWVQLDAPERVNQLLLDFLRD